MRRVALLERRWSRVRILDAKDGEKTPDILLRFEAVLGEGGRINENGRLYAPAEVARENSKLNARLQERGPRAGQDGHPGFLSEPTWGTVGVGWTEIRTEDRGGWVESVGQGFVPDTDAGRNVAVCMRLGFPIAFSLRGSGAQEQRVMDERDPCYAANSARAGEKYSAVSDLGIETYDTVVDPGFDNATVRSFQERLEAGDGAVVEVIQRAINKRLDEIEEERKMKTNEELQAALTASEKLVEELKAGNAAAVEARAKELSAKFEAQLAEAAKGQPTAEQSALLARVAKVPAERLEAAIKDAEAGAVPEAKVAAAALEARFGKLEAENKQLVEKLRLQEEAAAAAKAHAVLAAHASKITARLANGAKIAAILLDHCDSPESMDAELKRIVEAAGLTEVAEGLEPGAPAAGSAAPADLYEDSEGGPARPRVTTMDEARRRTAMIAGPDRPKRKPA